MRKFVLLKRFGVLVLLVGSQSAIAQPTAQEILRGVDANDKSSRTIINAIADGFGWANAYLSTRGQTMLFCQPEKLAITTDQNADMIRQYLQAYPGDSQRAVGLVLLRAYIYTFPCNGSQ